MAPWLDQYGDEFVRKDIREESGLYEVFGARHFTYLGLCFHIYEMGPNFLCGIMHPLALNSKVDVAVAEL